MEMSPPRDEAEERGSRGGAEDAEDRKVELVLRPRHPWCAEGSQVLQVTKCLPFFRKGPLRMVHRVRSANLHYWDGVLSHMSVEFWCGNLGVIGYIKRSRRGYRRDDQPSLFAVAPDPAVFCATCEGRAVGAGLDGAREINGRTVLFSPRERRGSRGGAEDAEGAGMGKGARD
jgi:hypothetical protein